MIKLSEPHFFGKEIDYLEECINSKWISAKGKLVANFETKIKNKLELRAIQPVTIMMKILRLKKQKTK